MHKLPQDLKKALNSKKAKETWEDITPLAKNEWICYVESAKQKETREKRIKRTKSDLEKGKRRPCCWIGCIHRSDKPMSPSQKFILKK